MRVTIMMGIPGSGKTTWVKENRPDAVVCSADDYWLDEDEYYNFVSKYIGLAHNECIYKFCEAVRDGTESVVVDNTNTSHLTMAPYVSVAKAYGYEVEFIACTSTHVDECKKRGVHDVPEKAVDGMLQSLSKALVSWPTFWPKPTYV